MRILRKLLIWPIFMIIASVIVFASCNPFANSKSDKVSSRAISNFGNSEEHFEIFTGRVMFDTLPESILTHKIDTGRKMIFVYKRSGTAMLDTYDWEAKYTETLIFQIDSTMQKGNFCDKDLKTIDCKYYWICYAKEMQKEIRNVTSGCIKADFMSDSVQININVTPGFKFEGYMDKNKSRTIKYIATVTNTRCNIKHKP